MSPTLFSLDHQTAMVTGAASGIGRRIAVGLAQSGADVACLDLPGSALEEVGEQVRVTGRKAITVAADVTDADSLRGAVEETHGRLGVLTLAVNSAGIAWPWNGRAAVSG